MKRLLNLFKSQQFLFFLIVLLVISNGMTVYFLIHQNISNNTNKQASFNFNDNSNASENFNQSALGPQIDISVDWLNQPISADVQGFFGNDFLQGEYNLNYQIQSGYPAEISYSDWLKTIQIYQVGKINTTGEYFNKDLFIISYSPGYWSGPGQSYVERIIKNGNDLVYLTNPQDFFADAFKTKKFANINITNLETVSNIIIPQTNIALVKSEAKPNRIFSDYPNIEERFKSNNETIYQDLDTNCFLVKANDGTAREYYFNLPFSGIIGQSSQYFGLTPSILDFYWLDGTKNSIEYLSDRYGSGNINGCLGYANYITDISLLNKAGQNSNGDIFYELKQDVKAGNPKYLVLQNMYDIYYPSYDETKQNAKISFAEFTKTHPIIFWQDPFGRFVEFKNAKYLPVAEMGKPVIYLYPEKAIKVSVEVSPTGGFSKTEPEYNNGWKVLANPSGELYNYSDHKTYPYLFWEGFGLNYERPKEGFVVKKEDIKNFLKARLVQSGLIKNEYDEFIAFWLPKMQSWPYYFITFVPQEQFNLLAPLKISPQPDTVIRVFMDYEGLGKPINVKSQTIKTPTRKGFTVVEWGGQLRH